MNHTHEGRHICGYCKKETPIDDDMLVGVIDGDRELLQEAPVCSCGHKYKSLLLLFTYSLDKSLYPLPSKIFLIKS